ncbi:FAD-dependent monooxygenase [Methylotenera mobilis]|uniref:Ubiquinone biosynthesis hydroxylase, UbiH/UbiF/VisC/COQ6 family n=1 Tax=Methylotenera mobilis (strain JLW8 / ATCC BAA-1282 / DSM 17540) TaxID=583345 RepID=C6WUA3_METML|nr:FAD-dependent monooxygenase [Methylotenera mobilis]ACT47502.1 Ubiquinone biosynthesis hydroxylase, UbiH/UbiF/VisC/COQ6 family [Methylotenera mobilis JLW8]
MMEPHLKTDVTIVGAGLVGMAAAVAFDQAGYQVALVDSQTQPVPSYSDEDWDQRIYAISPNNMQWLSQLGVWPLLDTKRIAEMQSMEIWGDTGAQPLQLHAEDVSANCLGFIVEERLLKDALLKSIQASNIRVIERHRCLSVQSSPQLTQLKLANQQVIDSTLLLAADGANSWVRQQLVVGVQHKDYEQTAIVANFVTEQSHANIARQWFTHDAAGRSAVLAWLPLPDNKISIVWSAPTEYAKSLLQLSADAFTHEVMQAGGGALGTMSLMGQPTGFPLALKHVSDSVKSSVVLVGDAAHRVHPMAGQGVNLGFRDVIDLLNLLSSKHVYQAINDAALLKQYARVRKADLLNMVTLTNGLYHLFESSYTVVKSARNWGLAAANQQTLRKLLVANAISL